MAENNWKFDLQWIDINKLQEHPQNYQEHQADQLEHIKKSLTDFGFYKNVVISNDNFILAGHGVVKAAKDLDLNKIPVYKIKHNFDDPKAMKLLIGDNEISNLSMKDDRLLSDLLKSVKDDLNGLLGTGYDEMMLANLVYITRDNSEINDFDAAAEWVGMPQYQEGEYRNKIIINFRNIKDHLSFQKQIGIDDQGTITSTWWPKKDRENPASMRFQP